MITPFQQNPNIWPNLNLIHTLLYDFLNVKHFFSQSLFSKYMIWCSIPTADLKHQFKNSLQSLNDHYFSTRLNLFHSTNLWPSPFFNFTLKRKILKIFSFNKFLPNVTMWYYNILIRFMESCTGKKIFLKF